VHSKSNEQLFSVDTTGDEQVRKRITKTSLKSLKSYQNLSQRSAVPAVSSRQKKHGAVTRAEKVRMLKAGRRIKGLLDTETIPVVVNEVQDAYELWDGDGVLRKSFSSRTKSVKSPGSLRPHTSVGISAVSLPHAGISYNPTLEDHQDLLKTAHEAEAKRVAEEEKWHGVKERMLTARHSQVEVEEDAALGMKVDKPIDTEVSEAEGESEMVKKVTKPKTKKQRRKAAIFLAEKRERAAQAARKKQLESITSKTLKSLKVKKVDPVANKRPDIPILDQQTKKRKKLGKHLLPTERVEVQLGEELSESLRELQPEGSLFRDRFESLQQRALVEPRVRVIPKKNKHRVKDYEKHAWKRFS